MIRAHLSGILAWTRLRVSNGALEGMNNKVKVVSHRAYGFRTTDNYIAAIWHGCGQLPWSLFHENGGLRKPGGATTGSYRRASSMQISNHTFGRRAQNFSSSWN